MIVAYRSAILARRSLPNFWHFVGWLRMNQQKIIKANPGLLQYLSANKNTNRPKNDISIHSCFNWMTNHIITWKTVVSPKHPLNIFFLSSQLDLQTKIHQGLVFGKRSETRNDGSVTSGRFQGIVYLSCRLVTPNGGKKDQGIRSFFRNKNAEKMIVICKKIMQPCLWMRNARTWSLQI